MSLKELNVVVTGGRRGPGPGQVESLRAHGATVTRTIREMFLATGTVGFRGTRTVGNR